MSWLVVTIVGLVALTAEVAVETASELVAAIVLDSDAGVAVELAPGPASDVVDTMPQASVVWARR